VRRQIVGGAARRGGDDEPVPDEVAQALDTVDGHPDVDRLSGLSGDGDLVERPSLHHLAGRGHGPHGKRMHVDPGGGADPFDETVGLEAVQQEPHRPAVHPENRSHRFAVTMHDMQQEPVAAEGDQHVAVVGMHPVVSVLDLREGQPGLVGVRADTAKPHPRLAV
jgi:hypothetical protein